ncbi:MAG TPA: NAD(P)H-binding protein, partial [Pseudolysinimonas sp.]|nr:NAD(P)H-binding protein [Pseudolysinimonas sp.]
LHHGVVGLVDGGGDVIAPITAITGRDAVAGHLIALLSPASGAVVTEHPVNAAPALVVRTDGHVVAVVSLGAADGMVTRVWITRSPQKLQRWNTPAAARVTDHSAALSELMTGGDTAPAPTGRHIMRIVVIGGTGLIGSQVVARLTQLGHQAIAASPGSGVNAYTGEGLADALTGADVVVDVTNSPSFEDSAVMDFFTTSTAHLLDAEKAAGVGHHVALSVVGAHRLPDSGYLRAKVAQERLIAESGRPYTIVTATQFYEFVRAIADSATVDGVVRLPHQLVQPLPSAFAAEAVADAAAGQPRNAAVEVGGPVALPMDEFIRAGLAALGDPREVVADPHATYFGTRLEERSLVADEGARLATLTYAEWVAR